MKNILPTICMLCAAISGCSTNSPVNEIHIERLTTPQFSDRSHIENIETVHHRDSAISGAAYNQSAYVHVMNKRHHNNVGLLSKPISSGVNEQSVPNTQTKEAKSKVDLGSTLAAANKAFSSDKAAGPSVSPNEENSEPKLSSSESGPKPSKLMSPGNKLKPISIYDYDHWVSVCKSKQYAPKASLSYVKKAGRDAMPKSLIEICSLSDSFFE